MQKFPLFFFPDRKVSLRTLLVKAEPVSLWGCISSTNPTNTTPPSNPTPMLLIDSCISLYKNLDELCILHNSSVGRNYINFYHVTPICGFLLNTRFRLIYPQFIVSEQSIRLDDSNLLTDPS